MKERQIALFDIDRTSYEGFLAFSLPELQQKTGIIPRTTVQAIAQELELYSGGFIPYEQMAENLLVHWAGGLEGKTVDTVVVETAEFLAGEGNKFYPYVESVIARISRTHDIYFVTAQPQFVAQVVSDIYQPSKFISSHFTVEDGKFTGDVAVSLGKSTQKHNAVVDVLTAHMYEGSFGFGDSEGDVDMLRMVEHAICINPTDNLRQFAVQNNWHITEPNRVLQIVEDILQR